MAKNPKYTQQDYQQAIRFCVDEENDALRVVVINPTDVKKEEVNANLRELIGTLKQKDVPQDRTDYTKLVQNIEKLTEVSINKKEEIKESTPMWVKVSVIVQLLCTIAILIK